MSKNYVIVIHGLPGSGKTTFAGFLKTELKAFHINADWARSTITRHLGFSPEDRLNQARTLGQLAKLSAKTNRWTIVDFVNPTHDTRNAFFAELGSETAFHSVWMNTITAGRFSDTNKLYEIPSLIQSLTIIESWCTEDEMSSHAKDLATYLKNIAGYKTFYIRYNTHTNGKNDLWRIIDAETKKETLVDYFNIHGYMTPASTIEHEQTKWNVCVSGVPEFRPISPASNPHYKLGFFMTE